MRTRGNSGGGSASLDAFLSALLTDGNWTQVSPSGYSANRIISFNATVGKEYLIIYWSIYTGAGVPVDPTGCTLLSKTLLNMTSPGYGSMRMYRVKATSTTVSHDTNVGTGTIWYQVVEL